MQVGSGGSDPSSSWSPSGAGLVGSSSGQSLLLKGLVCVSLCSYQGLLCPQVLLPKPGD